MAFSVGAYCVPQVAPGSAQQYQQLLARARHLIQTNNYQGAAQALEQAVKIAPDSLEALNDLGVAYAHLGNYHRAAQFYERALRLDPGSFPLLLNLGLAYFKGGNLPDATRSLSEATKLQPENFQARTLLAMSYYGAKKFTEASGQFEKLVAIKPDNTTLQYLLAQSYLQSGQDQKLLNYFQQLLRRSSQSATVYMLLGEADDGLDRTAEAIQEFRAAAALAPNQPDVNFGLGYLYWKSRQYDKAVPAFRKEIEAGGDVAKSDAYWGDILLREGNSRQARALIEQAIRLYPALRIAHLDLGILDAQAKRYAQAEGELKEAIRLDASQADARYRLAQVYRAEGKTQLAQVELKTVGAIHRREEEKLYKEISGPAR
jgi:tetratricopeptide (TPR) repeat protein